MTPRLPGFGPDGGTLWTLDSSAAFDLKGYDLVPLALQWDFWERLLALVQDGSLLFPRQVRRELANAKHPDLPGAWAPKAWRQMPNRRDPPDELVKEVLARHPQLVDPNSEADTADPYVVALALESFREGENVRVLATDKGLLAACADFELVTPQLDEFVQSVMSIEEPMSLATEESD